MSNIVVSPYDEQAEGQIASIFLRDNSLFEVGKNNIESIFQHSAGGEGDKWYWKVNFVNGDWIDIFEVISVHWKRNE